MSRRIWARNEHLRICQPPHGRKESCFAPIVGERFLAAWTARNLRALLDRSDLSLAWQGQAPGRPVCWLDDRTILMQVAQKAVAWTATEARAVWQSQGELLGLWNGHAILLAPDRRLSVLDAEGERVRCSDPIPDDVLAFGLVGQFALYESPQNRLVCLTLPECARLWEIEFMKESDVPTEHGGAVLTEITAHPGGEACTIKRGSVIGVLETSSGRFQWKRELRMGGSPLISHGRVALYFCGSLCVLDEDSGTIVIERSGVAPTRWEGPPTLFDDWMVIVDETGHIVTIGLPDGGVIGVQRQRGAGFRGCVSVDGRVIAGGHDGALWVYEQTGEEVI